MTGPLIDRVRERLAAESDPVLRRNLELLLQHMKAEAALDMEPLMATVSEHARYENFAALVEAYGIEINPVSFVLTHITVAAHLSWLANQGVLRPRGEGGRLLWERTA